MQRECCTDVLNRFDCFLSDYLWKNKRLFLAFEIRAIRNLRKIAIVHWRQGFWVKHVIFMHIKGT